MWANSTKSHKPQGWRVDLMMLGEPKLSALTRETPGQDIPQVTDTQLREMHAPNQKTLDLFLSLPNDRIENGFRKTTQNLTSINLLSNPSSASTLPKCVNPSSHANPQQNNGSISISTQLLEDLDAFSDSDGESLKLIDTKQFHPPTLKRQSTFDSKILKKPRSDDKATSSASLILPPGTTRSPLQHPEPPSRLSLPKTLDHDINSLQQYIKICEEKILLLAKRHAVSESTSLSFDAKEHWYLSTFRSKLKTIEDKQASLRSNFSFLDPLPIESNLSHISTLRSDLLSSREHTINDPDMLRSMHNFPLSPPAQHNRINNSTNFISNEILSSPPTHKDSSPLWQHTENDFERNKEEARRIIMENRSKQGEYENLINRPSNAQEDDEVEDDFGEGFMGGLQSSQFDDDDTDLSGFIAKDDADEESVDDTFVSPMPTQATALHGDDSEIDDSDHEDADFNDEINDIKLSQDVAERFGIQYTDDKKDKIEVIDLSQEGDNNASGGEDDEEVNPLDFTTQLNEGRDEVVEIPSEDDLEDEDLAALNELSHTKIKPEPGTEGLTIVSDSDFSDDDDELLQLSKTVAPDTLEKRVIPGSEKFIDEVYKVLNEVFGLSDFRPLQLEGICSTLNGNDVFVLIPTGGGKSLCYQLPALVKGGKTKGTTVVISPLISLMQDQVQHLMEKNIRAGMISSKGSSDERNATFKALTSGQLDLVYLSPEMVNNSARVQKVLDKLHENDMLARVVVDEAHCVSSWGHDFRPDYKGMSMFKENFPRVPVMALTATANEKVRLDIVHHLKMENPLLLKQSFNRVNLFYEVKNKPANIYEWVRDYVLGSRAGQTGIIYCHSKQSCETTSMKLNEWGIKSMYYHAGMDPNERFEIQTQWQQNEIQLICATIAFGMGIDKPDVRFVIHMYIPRSLEGYYQETGRAGRDGKDSECIMFYSYKDARSLQSLIQRDDKLEELARETHLAKLRQVVQYCENKTDCRRKQVLHFFNETFDPKNCAKKCDNCCSNILSVTKDVTSHCINIVKLVDMIQRDKVTVIHCQDIYKGSKNSKILKLGHHENPFHGAGSNLDRGDIERIFFHLQSEGCLLEYQVMRAGFASSYVKVGPRASLLLNGQKTIQLSFVQGKLSGANSSNSRARLVASGNGAGLSAYRLQDSFVSARDLRKQEQEKENEQRPQSKRIALPKDDYEGLINDGNEESIEAAYQELKNVRLLKLQELRLGRPTYLVGDILLKEMAVKLPTNARDFAKLTNVTKEQASVFQYFKRILGILARERKRNNQVELSTQSTFTQSNSTISESTSSIPFSLNGEHQIQKKYTQQRRPQKPYHSKNFKRNSGYKASQKSSQRSHQRYSQRGQQKPSRQVFSQTQTSPVRQMPL